MAWLLQSSLWTAIAKAPDASKTKEETSNISQSQFNCWYGLWSPTESVISSFQGKQKPTIQTSAWHKMRKNLGAFWGMHVYFNFRKPKTLISIINGGQLDHKLHLRDKKKYILLYINQFIILRTMKMEMLVSLITERTKLSVEFYSHERLVTFWVNKPKEE